MHDRPDIFVSYARSDRERVAPLVKFLESQGWRVWWDPAVQPGERFDRVIQTALDAARVVLVVWSRDSVQRDWVLNEAEEGKRRGILVPVRIDPVEIPLGFRRVQAADLVGWPKNKKPKQDELQKLFETIARSIESGGGSATSITLGAGRNRIRLGLAAVLALAFVVGAAATGWRLYQNHKVDRLIEAARQEINAGAFNKAERLLQEARNIDPGSADVRALTQQIKTALEKAKAACGTPGDGKTVQDCRDCPKLAEIPAGRYLMGSPAGDTMQWPGAELPQHEVTIATPFLIGRCEVTAREFRTFTDETGYQATPTCTIVDFNSGDYVVDPNASWRSPHFPQQPNHPVVCVSWADAKAYVAWLSRKTAKRYRLPSESEWEYAARAGAIGPTPWGADPGEACRFANVGDATALERFLPSAWAHDLHKCSDSFTFTAPVGHFQMNGFGLYDTVGNVWEWIEDCWNSNHSAAPVDGSPRESGQCDRRVFRGGSWVSFWRNNRFAARGKNLANRGYYSVGFRVVRER